MVYFWLTLYIVYVRPTHPVCFINQSVAAPDWSQTVHMPVCLNALPVALHAVDLESYLGLA